MAALETVAVSFDEEATTQTVTGTTLTKIHESAASLELGRRYLLLVRAALTSDSTANGKGVKFDVYDESNGAYFSDSLYIHNPQAVTKYHQFSYATVFNAGKNSGKIELHLAGEEATTEGKSAYCSTALIDVSDLTEGLDYFVSEDSTSRSHTTTYADRVSKALTVSTNTQADGEWLVIAHTRIDSNNNTNLTSPMSRLHFTDSVTLNTTPETKEETEYTTEFSSNVIARTYTVDSTSQTVYTWKVQTKDAASDASPHEYKSSRVVGLRLDAFADYSNSYSQSLLETTATTWQDAESITLAETAGTVKDYFVIGSFIAVPESTARTFKARLRNDNGTAVDESVMDSAQESSTTVTAHDSADQLSVFVFGKTDVDGDNGSHTITVESRKTSSANYGVQDRCLVAFRINSDARTSVRKVWNGSADNNIETAANWTPSGVPTTADDIIFSDGSVSTSAGELAVQKVFIGGSYDGIVTAITLQAKRILQTTKKPIVKFNVKGGVGWRNGLLNPVVVYLWDTPTKDDEIIIAAADTATTAQMFVRNARGRVKVEGDEWERVVGFSRSRCSVICTGDGAEVNLVGSGYFESTGSPSTVAVAGRCRYVQNGGGITTLKTFNDAQVVWKAATQYSDWNLYDGKIDLRELEEQYQAGTIKLYNATIDARTSIDGFLQPLFAFQVLANNSKILWDDEVRVTPS